MQQPSVPQSVSAALDWLTAEVRRSLSDVLPNDDEPDEPYDPHNPYTSSRASETDGWAPPRQPTVSVDHLTRWGVDNSCTIPVLGAADSFYKPLPINAAPPPAPPPQSAVTAAILVDRSPETQSTSTSNEPAAALSAHGRSSSSSVSSPFSPSRGAEQRPTSNDPFLLPTQSNDDAQFDDINLATQHTGTAQPLPPSPSAAQHHLPSPHGDPAPLPSVPDSPDAMSHDDAARALLSGAQFLFDDELNSALRLHQGSLCCLDVDAIVLFTDETYSCRDGPTGEALFRGGDALEHRLRNLEPCKPGEAKIVKATNLPCRYLIFTVGPKYNAKYIMAGENSIHSCYREALKLLCENGLSSIAFPCMPTFRRGFDSLDYCHIGMRTTRRWTERLREKLDLVLPESVAVMAQPLVRERRPAVCVAPTLARSLDGSLAHGVRRETAFPPPARAVLKLKFVPVWYMRKWEDFEATTNRRADRDGPDLRV
eukprot:Selendium_serpulae@DN5781_c1_g1_i5.p2